MSTQPELEGLGRIVRGGKGSGVGTRPRMLRRLESGASLYPPDNKVHLPQSCPVLPWILWKLLIWNLLQGPITAEEPRKSLRRIIPRGSLKVIWSNSTAFQTGIQEPERGSDLPKVT